jgi:hypothetical protein
MSGWSILAHCLVASTGAVYFLGLVANGMSDARGYLNALEEREWKLRKERHGGEEYVYPAASRERSSRAADA